MADTNEAITAPYQIVCEGPDDIALFDRLLRDRGIEGFQTGCGRGKENRQCRGRDGFSSRIQAIRTFRTFNPDVKGIVIVADTDHDPTDRFKFACRQLTNNSLSAPTKSLEIAVDEAGVRSGIIMLPAMDQHGGLETILLSCCAEYELNRECIQTFHTCCTSSDEHERRVVDADKLRPRALIAATKPSDPKHGNKLLA